MLVLGSRPQRLPLREPTLVCRHRILEKYEGNARFLGARGLGGGNCVPYLKVEEDVDARARGVAWQEWKEMRTEQLLTLRASQIRSAHSSAKSLSVAVSSPELSSPPRCTEPSSSAASTSTSSPSTPVTRSATRTSLRTFRQLSVLRRVTRSPSANAAH